MSAHRRPEDRFRQVFDEAHVAVYRYALRRCGDPQAAEDVMGDVFLAAWRRIDECPADHLPWLLAIARGALSNHRRGARRREALEELVRSEAEVAAQPAVPPDPALLEALARLPSSEREALLLVAWEGLDRRRAARVMGCSAPAFAARLHRARRRLAAELDRPLSAPADTERPIIEEPT